MNEYKALLDEGVVIFRFFADYVADEGDQLLQRFIKLLTIDEIYSIKTMIWDLSDVTSMTLHNTDRARMANFNKQLVSAIEHPEKNVDAFLSNLVLYYVKSKNKRVREIWVERLERLKTPTRTLPSMAAADVENLHELLKQLGLLRLAPMLDCEWQTV